MIGVLSWMVGCGFVRDRAELPPLDTIACRPEARLRAVPVGQAIPALDIDYLGVLSCSPAGGECEAQAWFGSLCAGASQAREASGDPLTQCERAVLFGGSEIHRGWRNSWREGFGDDNCCAYLGVYTKGDRVEYITDAAQWREVLGTVDNLEEASLLAMFQDRPTEARLDCANPMGVAHPEGFDVLVYDGTCGSASDVERRETPAPGVDAVRVRVRRDGSVTELTRERYLSPVCREGRRIVGGLDLR